MCKKIVSICCDSSVQHYPTKGLGATGDVLFFCDKCGNICKTKIVDEKDKKK